MKTIKEIGLVAENGSDQLSLVGELFDANGIHMIGFHVHKEERKCGLRIVVDDPEKAYLRLAGLYCRATIATLQNIGCGFEDEIRFRLGLVVAREAVLVRLRVADVARHLLEVVRDLVHRDRVERRVRRTAMAIA